LESIYPFHSKIVLRLKLKNKMKKLLKFIIPVVLITTSLVINSCTSSFEELNTNKTKLTAIDKSAVGNAFAAAQWRGVFGDRGPFQLMESLFADLHAQYYATVAINFPSDRNVMVGNWLNGAWGNFYGQQIPPLLVVLDATKPGGTAADPGIYAMASIWKVQMFLPMTDYWGPIPYSQVGNGAKSVDYDSQEAIYKDFFATLKSAVTELEKSKGKSFLGNNDQVYNGSVDKWILFANTMRLRLALRISKVDPALAKAEAEAAVAGGTLMTNADDAFVKVTANSPNPLGGITAWNEFRMSASMESTLKGYKDPRIGKFFSPVEGASGYKGLRNGYTQVQLGLPENSAGANSNVAPVFQDGARFNQAWGIMFASEAHFLRAEGALNGWNMGGTAKDLYQKGIALSMSQWGITDAAAVAAYTAGSSTPIALADVVKSPAMTDIPVAFASTIDKQREQIGTQKWLALFPYGFEAWAEFRRTGYPKLYPKLNSDNTDVPVTEIVRRAPFVSGEIATNKPGVDMGTTKLGGADNAKTRLWWDKN
jgi:Susd and RagB outer membrane lipoprotein